MVSGAAGLLHCVLVALESAVGEVVVIFADTANSVSGDGVAAAARAADFAPLVQTEPAGVLFDGAFVNHFILLPIFSGSRRPWRGA
jgi:hypothetical protein